jgi:alpha-1,2-mannosyltransferase
LKLKPGEFLLLIPLTTLAFPVKWTFGMGQVNNLILLLLVATFGFYKQRKNLWSGISLGLAVVLKLTPVFLLGLFLVKRKWRIVFSSLATILSLNLLAGLAFGFDLTSAYFFKIIPNLFGGAGKEVYYNQAMSGFIARGIADYNLRFYLSSFFFILILGISYWSVTKRGKLGSLDFSLLIMASLLINSLSWQHHFVWAIFPFLAVLAFLRKKRTNQKLGLLLLTSYLLIAFNIKNPAIFRSIFLGPLILSHVFFGALILFGLLFYCLTQKVELRK